MAKLVDFYEVKFKEVRDLDGYVKDDFLRDYVGKIGLLCVYESEKKDKGKKFVYFYPCEPDKSIQQYFYTSLGILTIIGKEMQLKSHHEYFFEQTSTLDKREWELLLLHAYTEDQLVLVKRA